MRLGLDGAFLLCVNDCIWNEYLEVLSRRKFAAVQDRAATMIANLEEKACFLNGGSKADAASDEDDNRFLECAADAAAEYLVTGNLKHYPAQWNATRVVNARQFLEEFAVNRNDQ